MARLALKPDSSFFRKIVIGAVGARSVCSDLDAHGHRTLELERGSTDTKLWKDVKRKRVRIPDLVCVRCGQRIESRAKTDPTLSMSHSDADEARAWDFGLVDSDLIAFPVCVPVKEEYWSAGRLGGDASYWHERSWVRWRVAGKINYFRVATFRSTRYARSTTKGVTEGSETSVSWGAVFSSRTGTVEKIEKSRITIRRQPDGHRHTWTVPVDMQLVVAPGDQVDLNQVIASTVKPVADPELACTASLSKAHISHLLHSRERTQRFTAIKLARLRNDSSFRDGVTELAEDKEEDIYIRLEALSYLSAVCRCSPSFLFSPYLNNADPQTQLESVIALSEVGTSEAVDLLSRLLDDKQRPYFFRSAVAWSLGRVGTEVATRRLVRAFCDIDVGIREQALEAIVSLGGDPVPELLNGIRSADRDIAAGCAEALRRRQRGLAEEVISRLAEDLRKPAPSPWTVWVLGHLPRERVVNAIAGLQESAPQLHYALSLLWSFLESWISRRWEVYPEPDASGTEHDGIA
jgi:hypothetical protein